jgi:hypothetical protein
MARKRKYPDKKRKPPLAVGDRVGSLEVISLNAGRKHRHQLVQVRSVDCDATCPDCHGLPKLARADHLRSGKVVSCGKLKRQRRHEYMVMKNSSAYYTDINSIDVVTLREALSLPGVDTRSGKPIGEARPKQIPHRERTSDIKPDPTKSQTTVFTPTSRTDKLLVDVPYQQTDAGFDAECAYWREHKEGPPEDFD